MFPPFLLYPLTFILSPLFKGGEEGRKN